MDKKEQARIKAQAVTYARLFLAKKYNQEYKDLYKAYCLNRGVELNSAGRPSSASDIDEREILAARENN